MFSLVFYRNDQAVLRHELKSDLITIGRDPSSDIQLTEDDISRNHAELKWQNGGYVIFDKSTNGTIVNNERVESRKLAIGDIIRLGEWRVAFEASEADIEKKTVVKDISPTKILKYESKKKELFTETLKLTVISPDGNKKNFKITKASIGSAPSNDIVITDDPYISSNHCVIKTSGDKFVLRDLKSTNGTSFNSRDISEVALPQKGEFRVGRTVIKFNIDRQSEKIKGSPLTSLGPIIGASRTMREIFTLIDRVAPSDANICICGESGTGKELFARYTHEASTRSKKPFIALNCGAIPENLIESEFFGHEKGSFTSSTGQHRGVFEQADGGTLFLDEIGEMPAELQTRLLRVLETKEIRRVGGSEDVPVDVRVITATNRDLKKLVTEKKFREDLFYRLYVVPVDIPPLRARKDDISIIAEHFIDLLSMDGNKTLAKDAVKKLASYQWPGNVRELKNTIQRAILTSTGEKISGADISFTGIENGSDKEPLTLLEKERHTIIKALERTRGNATEAAEDLGVSRTTLNSMIKRFKIDIAEIRK